MLSKLQTTYKIKKDLIKNRLNDFKQFYEKPVSWFYDNNEMVLKNVKKTDNERFFEELVFCLLTANTSAVMAMKAVDGVRDVLFSGNLEDIKKGLKRAGYRFPNKRAEYIVEAHNKNLDLKNLIESHSKNKVREFLVTNVKGLGYKEASHFLRNVGIFGLAILDKHILKSLHEFAVIKEIPKSMNKNRYLEIEQKYIDFSNKININMDELDLLLWSTKNGQVMK